MASDVVNHENRDLVNIGWFISTPGAFEVIVGKMFGCDHPSSGLKATPTYILQNCPGVQVFAAVLLKCFSNSDHLPKPIYPSKPLDS